ncbi:MAG: hypothetical protein LUG26_07805 [Ruminococcus sp.]|nr:hypothetical protein [Ruminococcus sp.]
MRYYSTQRPITPGAYPARVEIREIKNFDDKTYCEEIGREAWGYFDIVGSLLDCEAEQYELVKAGEREWYSVTVASKKKGGGLKAIVDNNVAKASKRPQDERFSTSVREFKRRYFDSLAEAERVCEVLNSIEITTERVRSSVTQGECRVIINDVYISNFGDNIIRLPKEANKEDYYGEDIGGYMSDQSDAEFTLGFIWHPYDYIYHYDKMICEKLGIEPEEWIGGAI